MRRLGRTGLHVSECTVGTAALKGSDPAMIAFALDRGVNAFEIDGSDREAAVLLGQVFKREGVRARVHVFARVSPLVRFDLPSPHVPADQAYPGHHIRAETEALLKMLGIERLALQQIHAWCPEWLGEGDWLDTLDRLKREGKIAGAGVSLFDHDLDSGLAAVASGAADTVQVMHNIFDQGAARALFPLCRKHDVGVIARSPLYFGALAGRAGRFAPGDWRHDYFYPEHARETDARAARLGGNSPVELALRFSLSNPAVATVAVGMRTREQAEANLRAFEKGPLSPEERAALAAHAWLC